MIKTVTFRTAAQAAIFECELKGQISDGAWENLPGDHWRDWCSATVLVGENVGVEGWARKDNYDFGRKDLVSVVGNRMKAYAKMALAGVATDEIRRLVDGFSDLDGNFRGMPTYDGKYWDETREYLRRYNAEWVQEVLAGDNYTDADLAADLREMKKTVKQQRS